MQVGVLVVVTVQKLVGDVEGAGHAHRVGDQVGVPQGEVDGVIAAETATGSAHLGPTGAVADERGDFADQVSVEGILAVEAVGGMDRAIVPGFLIDGIEADHLESARFDFGAEGVHHAAVLILVKAAARGRKDNDRESVFAVGQELDVPIERRAVPLDILPTHASLDMVARARFARGAGCRGPGAGGGVSGEMGSCRTGARGLFGSDWRSKWVRLVFSSFGAKVERPDLRHWQRASSSETA